MAQTIKLKRSATAGNTPTTSQLALGELGINTTDGKLFLKKSVSGTESVVEVGSGDSLPLSGGTLTGAITGTSATFSGETRTGSVRLTGAQNYVVPSVGVYSNGLWLNTPASTSGILGVAGTGVATWDSTGIDVTGSVVADGLTVDGAASIGSSTAKTKFYSDSTYNGIYNGSSLTSDESIYMGGDSMFFYASGKRRLDIKADGDISFRDSAGTSETFYWDSSTSRLGLGTTVPQGNLTISNAAGTNAPSTVTAANTYLQLGSDDYGSSNNGKFMIGLGYTDATNTNSPAYIGFEESSTSGDTKGDLTFYTRNVITDTAPTKRLTINADGSSVFSGSVVADVSTKTPFISLGTTTNSYQTVTGSSDGNDLTYRAYQNHVFKNVTGASSSTDGTDRLKIASNGDISFYNDSAAQGLFWDSSASNLGINTTTPSRKLDVNGGAIVRGFLTLYGTGTNNALFLNNTSYEWAAYTNASNNFVIADWNAAQTRLTIDTSGNATFSGDVTADKFKLSSTNFIDSPTTSIIRYSVGSGDHVFFSGSTSNSELLRINGSNGNVNIPNGGLMVGATTAPDASLRIDNESGIAFKVTGGSGGANLAEFTRDVGATATVAINASHARPQMSFAATGNTFAIGTGDSGFEIADNSVLGTNTRLTIDSSGRVGIGTVPSVWRTAYPDKVLDLGAHSALYDQFGGSTFLANNFYRSNDNSFKYKTTAGATAISLDAGQIGFLTAPSGTAGATATLTNHMLIDNQGRVGIGNAVASSMNAGANQLVVGSGSTGQGITLYSSTSTAGSIHFADGTSGDAAYRGQLVYNHNGDYMAILTAATERMRLNSDGSCRWTPDGTTHDMTLKADGNLLVGTTSTAVGAGGAGTTGFRVDGANGIVQVASNGTVAGIFNRTTSDGAIVEFRKNGTATVGSIGTFSGRMTIGTGNTGLFFDSIRQVLTPHTMTGNTYSTTIDLGRSIIPFKDLYLSGISYVGGLYNTGIYNQQSGDIQFWVTNVGEAVRIQQNTGNLLVGSSSTPGGSTDGTVIFASGTIASYRTGAAPAVFSRNASNGGEVVVIQQQGTTVGNISSVGGTDIKVTFSSDGDQYITGNSAGNYLSFSAANQERLRIDSQGRVGIGASPSTHRLEVKGDNNIAKFYSDTAATELKISSPTVNVIGLYTGTADALAFGTADTERLRITDASTRIYNSLMVGSTTAPSTKLEVTGMVGAAYTATAFNARSAIKIKQADADTNYASIQFTNTTGTYEKFFGTVQTSTNTADMVFQGYNRAVGVYQEYLRIEETGNLSLSGTVNAPKIGATDVGLYFNGSYNAVVPYRPDTDAAVDNYLDLGMYSYRFDDVFATNGTIQTSDRNEKQDIESLTEAEERVAVATKGLLKKFRWKSSVAEKGDDARVHFGIIAQDLQAAFEAEGLDAGRYGMFTSDTWTDEDGEEQTRMGVRYSELLAFIISAI